jgi:vitamin B12 transporter
VDDNETFGTYGTYRAGFSFRPVAGTRFRGAVGTGFKEPTFFENFDTGFSTGNPALKPEHSASWEVGVEHTHQDWLRIGAVYFSQRFRDLIQYTFAPADPTGPNYYNVASANASGVEVTAHLSIAGFTADGSYTNLKSSVLDAGFDTGPAANFVEGKRLLRRPTHLLSFHVSRDLAGRGSAIVGVRHVGDREDLDFSSFPFTRPTLSAYTVFDAAGEVILLRARPRLTATFRVENLSDAEYAEVFGFPARGRAVLVGGRLAF